MRRRNNGSVLQMMHTLEIDSIAKKRKSQSPASSTDQNARKVLRLSPSTWVSSISQVSPFSSLPAMGSYQEVVDEDDCSDDDSFVSAKSTMSSHSLRCDLPIFADKPFEIGIPTLTRKPSRRPRSNGKLPDQFSFCVDNDIVHQIEAMASYVETACERRHLSKSTHVNSYDYLPECLPIRKFKAEKNTSEMTSPLQAQKNLLSTLSPDPLQLFRRSPKARQPEDDLPEMEHILDCSYDSLASLDSVSTISTKQMKPTQMHNEEWSYPTPTKIPSAFLQRMEQRFGEGISVPAPSKTSTASAQHMAHP